MAAGRTVRTFSVETASPLGTLQGHSGLVTCVDFCTRLVVSGATDRTVRLWSWEDMSCARISAKRGQHQEAVSGVRFTSASGSKLLSCSLDGTLKLWHSEQGQCERTIGGGSGVGVGSILAMESTGSWREERSVFVTGSSYCAANTWTGRVALWDLRQGKPAVSHVDLPADAAPALSCYPAEQTLAVGGSDGVVRVWDLRKFSASTPLCVVGGQTGGPIVSVHVDKARLLVCQSKVMTVYHARTR
jgi:WD40 repeat protein